MTSVFLVVSMCAYGNSVLLCSHTVGSMFMDEMYGMDNMSELLKPSLEIGVMHAFVYAMVMVSFF